MSYKAWWGRIEWQGENEGKKLQRQCGIQIRCSNITEVKTISPNYLNASEEIKKIMVDRTISLSCVPSNKKLERDMLAYI